MPIDITLNNDPVLAMSLHLPVNGAWSAELSVGTDVELATGDTVALDLDNVSYVGRVVRAAVFAERLQVRLTGGGIDWGEVQDVRHYRDVAADDVISDVGVVTDAPLNAPLAFWTRNPGTTGSTVESIARFLDLPWRVNPDGTVRLRAEGSPEVLPSEVATELSRNPGRGTVTVAPEQALLAPGTQLGDDVLTDVIYDLTSEGVRARYSVVPGGKLRNALERLIRWVTRDTLFLGKYTAQVIRQAGDGTLDLLPDDIRIRAQGLQGVPIRHGLPGVTVEVLPGSKVLLGFDGGDPCQPYAALWHEGAVVKVHIGGQRAVAMDDLVAARLDAMQVAISTHLHPTAAVGPPSPPTPPIVWPALPTDSKVLFTN